MTGRSSERAHGARWARIVAVLAGAFVVTAACAPSPSPPPGSPSPAPSGTRGPGPTGTATPTTSPSPAGAVLRVYLILGLGSQVGLVPVERRDAQDLATADAAVRLLLQGPSDAEQALRPAIYTAIPRGVELLGVSIDEGIATVDLSGAFEAPTEDGLPTSMRIAQVVFTLTGLAGVDSVRFRIDGELVTLLGPDGPRFSVDGPLGRGDLLKALPPLFVDEPAWGTTISSPVHVSGLANAFEATFELRIADAEGRALAAGQVTATCGTGCWGDFDVLVPFTVQAVGPGVLQVFELSPRDGARQNLREYPVTLLP